jgi:RHS repeat-associated protein
MWGYRGGVAALGSLLWTVYQQAPDFGGDEHDPPPGITKDDILALDGTESIDTITKAITQYGRVKIRDDNGNQVMGGFRWIKYDSENRPIMVVTNDGTVVTYTYDWQGNRVQQSVILSGSEESNSTIYIGTIFEETYVDSTLTTQANHIFLGDNQIAIESRDTIPGPWDLSYYHTDHLGSIQLMTDENANIVRNTAYAPYGGLVSNTGTRETSHKFTGQEYDFATNLSFFKSRYYDPKTCQFLTPDPIIPHTAYDPQNLNRFAYCRNNPIRYSDPTGHMTVEEFGINVVGNAIGIATAILTGGACGGVVWADNGQITAFAWVGFKGGGGTVGEKQSDNQNDYWDNQDTTPFIDSIDELNSCSLYKPMPDASPNRFAGGSSYEMQREAQRYAKVRAWNKFNLMMDYGEYTAKIAAKAAAQTFNSAIKMPTGMYNSNDRSFARSMLKGSKYLPNPIIAGTGGVGDALLGYMDTIQTSGFGKQLLNYSGEQLFSGVLDVATEQNSLSKYLKKAYDLGSDRNNWDKNNK